MKRLLAILTVGLLAAGAGTASDAVKSDLKSLQGTWKIVALDVFGKREEIGKTEPLKDGDKKAEPEKTKPQQIVIHGNQLTIGPRGGGGKALTFKIDPKSNPKALDLMIPKGEISVEWKCIYAVEGDTLKLLVPLIPQAGEQGGDGYGATKRPESFDTTGKPFLLYTAEREKK